MAQEKIKLAYSQNQLRMRVTFVASYCSEVPEPPVVLINRARAKLESERDAGKLDFIEVYDDELKSLWNEIRHDLSDGGDPNRIVVYTLGCGAPNIREIQIEPSDNEQVAFYLTFKGDPKFANNWFFDFVRLNIKDRMVRAGVDRAGNWAQVYSCWLRACRNDAIKSAPIMFPPNVASIDTNKGYAIIGSKGRQEVIVAVTGREIFRDKERMQELVRSAAGAASKLQAVTGVKMTFLKEQLVDRLKGALRGQEQYGAALPAIYLAAFPAKAAVAEKGPQPRRTEAVKAPEPEPSSYPGKGLLQFGFSQHNMQAMIDRFDVKLYDHPDFTVTTDWVLKEAKSADIRFGISDAIKDKLTAMIEKGMDLNGVVVAEGKEPVYSRAPYIYENYKESTVKNLEENIDIRDAQQRSVVKAGDLVAEIRYEQAPENGMDVLKQVIVPEGGEELIVTLGEGIEMRENGKYYATVDGVPTVQDASISLSQILIHEGDVNLRSGNIYFDGPAEIKGAIDSGATVEVTGDLVVHGTIRDAYVRVGGNLEARSGIVTGNRGVVRVRNDLLAEFCENSRIMCGGNVVVKKALVNCNVVCGGSIHLNETDGVVAGGKVSCKKFIRTAKLGFPKGARTVASAGVDWKAKVSVDLREERLNRVVEANATDRNDLRELTRKKQKTKKHQEKIAEIQARLQKQRPLIDKLRAHLEKAKEELTYDSDARIYVHGTLHANCELEVGGISVPVTHDVAEVEISPKRQRGTHIHPLMEEDDNDRKRAG